MTNSPNLPASYLCRAAICVAALALPFAVNAGTMDKNPVVENLQRPFDWTGFYIGGNIGGTQGEFDFRGSGGDTDGHLFSDVDVARQLDDFLEPGFFDSTIVRFTDKFDNDRPDREEFDGSIIGGGQIGYQFQFGHFVFGIEGDFDRTANRSAVAFREVASGDFGNPIPQVVNGSGKGGGFPGLGPLESVSGTTDFTGRREAQVNWQGSVRAKVGYATGPMLFYGTGGVTFAQMDVWAHDVANSVFEARFDGADLANGINAPQGGPDQLATVRIVDTAVDKDDDVLVGWTAGAGIEVALNDAVSLGLEYRHNDYGDETFHFNDHHSDGRISSGGTKVSFDSDQVTVKMNILLNHFFGNGGSVASTTPAKSNVAIKSPFGATNENAQVAYTKAQDADKWSAKEVTKVEEPFNWTGFYLGGNIGGVWTDYDFSHYDSEVDTGLLFFENENFTRINADAAEPNAPQGPGPEFSSVFAPFEAPSQDRGSDDSIIGGGQVGYQYQFGHFVVGVEGDFSGLSTEKSAQFATSTFQFIDFGPEGTSSETRLFSDRKATVDWMASARLKLGYARGPVMLYVTGGGAWANVRTWATDLAISDYFIPFIGKGQSVNFSARTSNNTNDEDLVSGWTAGGGAEWAFSKIASIAMEYRHNGFDSADSHYDPHHSFISGSGNNVDIDSDQVTVKVNLLLGHMGPGH